MNSFRTGRNQNDYGEFAVYRSDNEIKQQIERNTKVRENFAPIRKRQQRKRQQINRNKWEKFKNLRSNKLNEKFAADNDTINSSTSESVGGAAVTPETGL